MDEDNVRQVDPTSYGFEDDIESEAIGAGRICHRSVVSRFLSEGPILGNE